MRPYPRRFSRRTRQTFRGDLIDDRPAGIAEREQPRDFVIGFAGGVVARAAETPELKSARCGIAVSARGLHVIEQRVPAGNYQANRRAAAGPSRRVRLQKYGVNMAFEVIDGHERLSDFRRQDLAVGHARPAANRPGPGLASRRRRRCPQSRGPLEEALRAPRERFGADARARRVRERRRRICGGYRAARRRRSTKYRGHPRRLPRRFRHTKIRFQECALACFPFTEWKNLHVSTGRRKRLPGAAMPQANDSPSRESDLRMHTIAGISPLEQLCFLLMSPSYRSECYTSIEHSSPIRRAPHGRRFQKPSRLNVERTPETVWSGHVRHVVGENKNENSAL